MMELPSLRTASVFGVDSSYFWATENKQKFSFRVYDDDDYLLRAVKPLFLSKPNKRNSETLSIIEGRTMRHKCRVAP